MPNRVHILGQRRVRLLDDKVLDVVDWRMSREKRPVWVRVLKSATPLRKSTGCRNSAGSQEP